MKRKEKGDALVCIASGKSIAATAREVGVDRSTVRSWLRDPVFAAEAAALRELAAELRHDPPALLVVVCEAVDRVSVRPPKVERPVGYTPNP